MAMDTRICSGTRLICFNLWIALVIFYFVFYTFASVLVGAFKIICHPPTLSANIPAARFFYYIKVTWLILLQMLQFIIQIFDGKIPFDFKNCCIENNKNIVNLLALVLTYITCTGIFLIFIRLRIWDYALTISLMHIGISCAVMQDFPFNWQWWLAFGLSVLFMIILGQVALTWCCKEKTATARVTSRDNLVA